MHQVMEILILAGVVLSLFVAFLASGVGRSRIRWFLLSLTITPLIAGFLLLRVGPPNAKHPVFYE